MFKMDFMVSPNVNFRDDPKFVHLDDTLRCLGYVFTHHIDIWINLAKAQTSVKTMSDIHAGKIFNGLLVTSPRSTNRGDNPLEINDDDFSAVLFTFQQCVNKNLKLQHYAELIKDPIDCMWDFCFYFIAPVRLAKNTVPRDVVMNSLRKWLSVSFVLPFITTYANKYQNIIASVDFINSVYGKISESEDRMGTIKSIPFEHIVACIGKKWNPNNTSHLLVRTFMHIFLMATSEIIKKYCPNIADCYRLNPTYDGTWIDEYDRMFDEHIRKLNSMCENLDTKVRPT